MKAKRLRLVRKPPARGKPAEQRGHNGAYRATGDKEPHRRFQSERGSQNQQEFGKGSHQEQRDREMGCDGMKPPEKVPCRSQSVCCNRSLKRLFRRLVRNNIIRSMMPLRRGGRIVHRRNCVIIHGRCVVPLHLHHFSIAHIMLVPLMSTACTGQQHEHGRQNGQGLTREVSDRHAHLTPVRGTPLKIF